MLSRSDVERDRYQARLKWERDQTAFIEESREEGRAEVKWIAQIQLCERILKLPLTSEATLAALAPDELHARAEALEWQLGFNDK